MLRIMERSRLFYAETRKSVMAAAPLHLLELA
jgi:hypothetical protein